MEFSGDELRQIYLESPADLCSEQIEVELPKYLYEKLSDDLKIFLVQIREKASIMKER